MRALIALTVAALATSAVDADRATAMVTVSGGAHAGDFGLRNADIPCEVTEESPPRARHQFSVTLGGSSRSNDPNELTLLIVVVPNADVRGANHEFFTSIHFGDVSRGTRYDAETRQGETPVGGGSITIAPHGRDATVTFDVASAEGVAYAGTIQCTGISRF
jgi:hypothetical protein